MLTLIACIVFVLIAAGALGLVTLGPERIWRLAGPADLGDVAFETLQRRRTPNDALACPAGLCQARSDLVPPVWRASVGELRAAFGRALQAEAGLQQVAGDEQSLKCRYVQRTKLMRFPDTIVVRFLEAGEGRSTLALYSRSQIGAGDLGANRARIDRWLASLAKELPPAQ